MGTREALVSLCLVLIIIQETLAGGHLLDGIYCGRRDCYEVLNVTRDATKQEIGRSYRRLARQHHPDSHKGEEAKRLAEETFTLIATAYEILKDDEERSDYDYMLDNPQEYYAHYYRYYRRRMAPKVDVRLVIIVVVTVISVVQYYGARQRYESAIAYFATVPKYRNRALDMAKAEEAEIWAKKKDGNRRIAKSEQKEEVEKLIRRVIQEKMDIKGSYAKPEIIDVLWIQLIIFPYTLYKYIVWYARWIWKFVLRKEPYGREEKLYIIRKKMKLGVHEFNGLGEETLQEYLDGELWIDSHFKEWKEEVDEENKKKLAENAKYKQYRRYMKTHGPGRITFDD